MASDGECLRVYQAVIDGRALLAEISTAKRKKRMMESTLSLSTDSSLQEHVGQVVIYLFSVLSVHFKSMRFMLWKAEILNALILHFVSTLKFVLVYLSLTPKGLFRFLIKRNARLKFKCLLSLHF